MQIFLLYLFLFIFGCTVGWVTEVFFRRFFSAKKWVNPGFMKGPWLPLYGFGVVLMFTTCYIIQGVLPSGLTFYNPSGDLFGRTTASGATAADLIPISIMWVSMVALEFFAGLIFIKGFRVKLWDYTNMKGNILGIICPVFTLIWLAVAILYYYALNPFFYKLATRVYVYMFGGNGAVAHFSFIFALGLVYGLMIYDLVVSLGVFNAVSEFAKRSGIIEKYEEAKLRFDQAAESGKQKVFSALPEVIKQGIIEHKNKPKEGNAITKKVKEAIYIDPELEKDKIVNYDENGRPVKTDVND